MGFGEGVWKPSALFRVYPTVCELMYFTDNELLTFHRQGTFTDVQLASFSPCWISLYRFLSGHTHTHGNSAGKKKVGGDQPVITRVQQKLCGNLLNSVEPYHHFLQRRKTTDHLHHLFLLLFIYS